MRSGYGHGQGGEGGFLSQLVRVRVRVSWAHALLRSQLAVFKVLEPRSDVTLTLHLPGQKGVFTTQNLRSAVGVLGLLGPGWTRVETSLSVGAAASLGWSDTGSGSPYFPAPGVWVSLARGEGTGLSQTGSMRGPAAL